ncbi:MAG: TldD/PmbA family protein [Actinomycetota bacterium]
MTATGARTPEAPLSADAARAAARRILEHPGADGVEVVVAASLTGLTRYAGSEIIQNTVRDEVRAYIRVVAGDRLASASTNQLDDEHMRDATAGALEAARASPPDPGFPGLAHPEDVGNAPPLFRWDEDTARRSAAGRAEAVRRILRAVGKGRAAGIYETSAHMYSVFSSTGIDCYDAFTRCVTTCLLDTGGSTGWGEDSSHAADDVDVEAVARRAADKAARGPAVRDAKPGSYEVILEPPAVSTLLEYLSYSGFGAKQVLDGESFLSTRAGDVVATDAITISDDVAHPRSVGISFDLEGVPRARVAVIDSGKATRPVNDLRTARMLGEEPTGHSSGSNEFGPYASNVVLTAGDRSMNELIGAVDDGLLVTRFHYVNILDRPHTLLTGMTRDGTFRIRAGEVAEPLHNLRFTQSVLDALASVQGVGRDLSAFAPEYGSFGSGVAPALRVGAFNFTSQTSH